MKIHVFSWGSMYFHAYENTWNLVQVKFPTLGTKFCIKSFGNAPPILVLGGVGLNIDRCIMIRSYCRTCMYVAKDNHVHKLIKPNCMCLTSCCRTTKFSCKQEYLLLLVHAAVEATDKNMHVLVAYSSIQNFT